MVRGELVHDPEHGWIMAVVAARKSLIPNGEMSEWLKEHAWKTIRATLTKSR
jgi:hypothetical protein